MLDSTKDILILFFAFLAGIIKVALSYYIYSRNKNSKSNIFFGLLFLSQGIWDLGKGILWLTYDPGFALFWGRVSYTGYVLSLFFLPHFCWAYLRRRNAITKSELGIVLWYVPALILVISLWFSRFFISGITLPESSSHGVFFWVYQFGPIYNKFFFVYQMIPLIYALGTFASKYFRTKLFDLRAQIRFFMLGISIPIVIGIPTGVILPMLGIVLPPHNHILTLFMSIFVAIGIIKYKFLTLNPLLEEPRVVKFTHHDVKKYQLDFSKNYIVDSDDSSGFAYEIFLNHIYQKRVGLIITHQDPKLIREKYGLKQTSIVYITDSETDELSIGPHDLEQLLETITNFSKNHSNSYVILDGLSYLVLYNGFQKVAYFLKRAIEEITSEASTLIMPMGEFNPNRKQRYLLERDFLFIPSRRYLYETKHLTDFEQIHPSKLNYFVLDYGPISRAILHEFILRGIKATLVTEKEVDSEIKNHVKLVKSNPLNKYVIHKLNIDHDNSVVILSFDNDPDTVLAVNIIREFTEKARIIAKIDKEKFIPAVKKAGANEVIPSSAIGGKLMSLALTTPDVVEWVMDSITYQTTELELMEFDILKGSRFVGKRIKYLDKIFRDIANILAVNRMKDFKQVPDPEFVLAEGDKVIMVTDLEKLKKDPKLYKLLKYKIESSLHKRKHHN